MSASALAIGWDGGERGRVVTLAGENITVRSSKPFAPGSRPEGKVGSSDTLRMKTHRCRREDGEDGLLYTIEGRALDMPRDLRVRLEELTR
ncbi:MAG: hypothetical protein HOW73_46330 [Polyangiaceae bacterium]|nr:hypothetical protein [Polyangiaceae bacterium]